MAGFQIVITDAGREEVVNAENNGTAPVEIVAVAVGTGQYTPNKTQTALVNETKRINSVSGISVGDDIIHINASDDSSDVYDIYEFGLITDSGTLFAVFSQVGSPILNKTASSIALLSCDIKVSTVDVNSITFGDTNFTNPPSSETQRGIIEIATQAETDAGTDDQRAITPKKLSVFIGTFYQYASQAEAEAGTSDGRVMSPVRTHQAIDVKAPGIAQMDHRIALVGAGVQLQENLMYHIATDNTYTLPNTTGLAGGTTIVLTKSVYNTPVIQVDGTNGENIRIGRPDGGTEFDTAVLFDINSEIVMVWNSTSWEV